MPFPTYVYYRYNEIAYPERRLRADILFGSLLIVSLILLLYFNITFKRKAHLVFDRDRQIVYSWRKGKAWVRRYEHLDSWFNYQALRFRLRGWTRKGELGWVHYAIQPAGNNLYGGGKNVYDTVLSCVIKFMKHGREAVWHEDWEEKDNFYFFDDKKPDDFESQVSELLAEIDAESIK